MSAFRCTNCGTVAEISAPDGTLTLGRKSRPIDEQAPNCICGAKSWALCGSMTEFYAYTGRADVCRFGEHRDSRAKPYTVVSTVHTAAPEGFMQLSNLQINVCPDHYEQLRTEDYLGFILEDP
jgi:hypothetical protein